MAYTKSGWFVQTLLSCMTQTTQTGNPTSLNFGLTANDAYEKCSLVLSSASDGSAPLLFSSATLGIWSNASECTGTNWSTGGVLLSTAFSGADVVQTFTNPVTSPATLVYTWTHPISVASTTISTNIYGMIIYFNAITLPLNTPELLSLCFGASYTTTNGTLSITPAGGGLSALTLSQ
jgi:hypothetical protein